MMAAHEPTPNTETRLTRARSEFVATLGRRLTALHNTLRQLEDDPASRERRDMLLRRVHALSSAAKVLGFDGVAEALDDAERALGRSAAGGPVTATDLAAVSRAFDLLPSIAWGAKIPPRAVPELQEELGPVALGWPLTILVYGPAALRSAATSADEQLVECELAQDADEFRELAKKIGPDVAVIDGDQRHARELLDNLAHDPLVEPFPVIVVGTFDNPEAASRFVASGAARVLPKPVGPEALQRALLDVSQQETGLRGPREPVGDVTVDELAERVAAEVRRGLVDGAEPASRGLTVPLGDGVEVLAAVWGAVARVRELVTMRSGGSVRFGAGGPEGAVPLAPWTTADRRAGERGSAVARRTDGVRLEGRRAVVVDDDPAVVWFLSGLLKTSGVEVAEAHDGLRARELVFDGMPDVVVSDVLMPGLDGFSLCREVKRDVAVRDVPVILLSWKEDLLQRVRELGAGADGYLRKEAAASTVLQRVREVLRPRARVEARLSGGGEVRGRLDGLTTRLLFQLAQKYQPNSRIVVRDAVYLYELEMRDGALRTVTRTATDGRFERGSRVLDALIGVSAGRFVIAPSTANCRDELRATLEQALQPRVRRARVLQRLVEGATVDHIDAMVIDPETIGAYAEATPAPARGVLEKLLDGVPPREAVPPGDPNRHLLDIVLSDIVRRGAVRELWRDGVKLDLDESPSLEPVTPEHQESPPPLFTLELSAAPPDVADAMARWEQPEVVMREGAAALPLSRTVTPPIVAQSRSGSELFAEPNTAPGVGPVLMTAAPTPRPEPADLEVASSGLPDARLVERSSEDLAVPERTSEDRLDAGWDRPPDPSAEPSDARAEAAPPVEVETARSPEMPSTPALVSGGFEPVKESIELPAHAFPSERDAPSTLRAEEEKESMDPGDEVPVPLTKTASAPPERARASTLPSARPIEFPRARKEPSSERPAANSAPKRPEPPVGPAPGAEEPPPLGAGRIALISLAAAVVAFGAVTLLRGLVGAPAPTALETSSAAPSAVPVPVTKPAAVEPSIQDMEMPPGVPVSSDKGLLEVDLGAKHAVYVDGAFVGRGPLRRVPLGPGMHQVLLKLPEGEIPIQAEIKAGRRLRVRLPASP